MKVGISMIMTELNKILIKQKGLLIILMMVLLKIALTLYQGYDSNHVINQNPEGYKHYLSLYEGKLTETKKDEIAQEYYAVNHALGELDELKRQLAEGKIAKDEYENSSKENYARLNNNEVFNVIYHQYDYANQNPEERYIMDERGWNTILSHDKLDFLFFLCLIVILTPLFCIEYESGMDKLLLSSSKGKYQACIIKLMIGCSLAILICVFFSLIEYICINKMVGLHNGKFPLQSLEFFASSNKDISLNNALIIVLLSRILGAVLFSVSIALIAILSRKSIITLFLSSVIGFLPFLFSQGKSLMYYLPFPSGLLSGVGYLWGTSYLTTMNEYGGVEKLIQFQEIDKGVFPFLIAGYSMEILIIFLLCNKKFSRDSFRLSKLLKSQKSTQTFLSLLCIVVLSALSSTGCGTNEYKDNFTYNAQTQNYRGETSGYAISLNITESTITAHNVKTGEDTSITRNPFGEKGQIQVIFVRDGWCYYLTKIPGYKGLQIYGIDMITFKEKLIYSSLDDNTEDFYGFAAQQEDELYFADNSIIWTFFLNENYIYYAGTSSMVKVNRKTGTETVIARDMRNYLYYQNGSVFYINNQYRLVSLKAGEDEAHPVDSIYTDYFTIENNVIKYRSLLDNHKILSHPIEPD